MEYFTVLPYRKAEASSIQKYVYEHWFHQVTRYLQFKYVRRLTDKVQQGKERERRDGAR